MQAVAISAVYVGSAIVSLASIAVIAWSLSKLWGF